MTKMIRVENADTSTYKVKVHVEDLQPNGSWLRTETLDCDYPTAMVNKGITSTRRLVIEEVN
jgi:hypothetical protein